MCLIVKEESTTTVRRPEWDARPEGHMPHSSPKTVKENSGEKKTIEIFSFRREKMPYSSPRLLRKSQKKKKQFLLLDLIQYKICPTLPPRLSRKRQKEKLFRFFYSGQIFPLVFPATVEKKSGGKKSGKFKITL